MMAQNDLVVVGIDVAKDKVDACIRRFTLRQAFPNTAQGHRMLNVGRDDESYEVCLPDLKSEIFLRRGVDRKKPVGQISRDEAGGGRFPVLRFPKFL